MKMRMIKTLVSQSLEVADMTDATTTGTIDFSDALPVGAMVLGWKAVVTGAFAGDTKAEISVGISGDLNKYSANSTGQNAFTVGTYGSLALALDAVTGFSAEKTPRVTITSGSNFTDVVTDAGGVMVVTMYYIDTREG